MRAVSILTEMRDALATKANLANFRSGLKEDMAGLRTELKSDIASLKRRTTVQFLVTIVAILLTNIQTIQMLGRMLNLVK